jgi:hypothetical protein
MDIFRFRTHFSSILELMIGLFSIFVVMKTQWNFMEVPYDPGEYKLT